MKTTQGDLILDAVKLLEDRSELGYKLVYEMMTSLYKKYSDSELRKIFGNELCFKIVNYLD